MCHKFLLTLSFVVLTLKSYRQAALALQKKQSVAGRDARLAPQAGAYRPSSTRTATSSRHDIRKGNSLIKDIVC